MIVRCLEGEGGFPGIHRAAVVDQFSHGEPLVEVFVPFEWKSLHDKSMDWEIL